MLGCAPPLPPRSGTATTTAFPSTACYLTHQPFTIHLRFTPHQSGALPRPSSTPNLAPTNTPWQPFYWGDHHHPHGPEPEPLPRRETRRPHAPSPVSDSGPDDDSHLQSYAQPVIESSFKGGTTVNAICSVRDPHHARNPLATIQLTVGLDSYSDVTVAHRDFVYNVRLITERVSTGGGLAQFDEEGLVDVVDGPSSFRTIPALVAQHPSHLPTHCMLQWSWGDVTTVPTQLTAHYLYRTVEPAY